MQDHGHSHLRHGPARAADPVSTRHDEAEHRSAANRALVYSAIGLGLAGGIEMVFAVFTHSVGLLGDALHNLSDVSTPCSSSSGSGCPSDQPRLDTPTVMTRAEDITGIGVALAIWASALFAGFESVRKLVHHGETTHVGWGIAAAVVGIAGNQAVAWYKGRIGRRIQSATLVADARHSWLDAISSLGAAVDW